MSISNLSSSANSTTIACDRLICNTMQCDDEADHQNMICEVLTCPNLYNGEIRWVFHAPKQLIPASTTNGFAFSGFVEQPDSTGDASQFNTSNGEWTCQKAGVYEIDFSQYWNIGVSSGGYNRSFVLVSGGSGGSRILCDVFENPIVGGLAGSGGSCRYRFELNEKVAVKIANGSPDPEFMGCDVEIIFLRD
jgi:hypothetical protein